MKTYFILLLSLSLFFTQNTTEDYILNYTDTMHVLKENGEAILKNNVGINDSVTLEVYSYLVQNDLLSS